MNRLEGDRLSFERGNWAIIKPTANENSQLIIPTSQDFQVSPSDLRGQSLQLKNPETWRPKILDEKPQTTDGEKPKAPVAEKPIKQTQPLPGPYQSEVVVWQAPKLPTPSLEQGLSRAEKYRRKEETRRRVNTEAVTSRVSIDPRRRAA